jgi:hypothetical protein
MRISTLYSHAMQHCKVLAPFVARHVYTWRTVHHNTMLLQATRCTIRYTMHKPNTCPPPQWSTELCQPSSPHPPPRSSQQHVSVWYNVNSTSTYAYVSRRMLPDASCMLVQPCIHDAQQQSPLSWGAAGSRAAYRQRRARPPPRCARKARATAPAPLPEAPRAIHSAFSPYRPYREVSPCWCASLYWARLR